MNFATECVNVCRGLYGIPLCHLLGVDTAALDVLHTLERKALARLRRERACAHSGVKGEPQQLVQPALFVSTLIEYEREDDELLWDEFRPLAADEDLNRVSRAVWSGSFPITQMLPLFIQLGTHRFLCIFVFPERGVSFNIIHLFISLSFFVFLYLSFILLLLREQN